MSAPKNRSCRRWACCTSATAFLSPDHDACDGHLGVPSYMIGLVGWIVTAEPRFEAVNRKEIFGLIVNVTEPTFGHSGSGDLPLEAFFVKLKEVKPIANSTKIEPKRVSVLVQDTVRTANMLGRRGGRQ